MTVAIVLGFGLVAVVILALSGAASDRTQVATPTRIDLPLLHSINDDRCIGCEACIDACPTKVLELIQHKARVVRFSDCVQCEQCAWACPTSALVMYREGTEPRPLTVPQLDEHFQTSVPGQYLIGEVAGKPLVKNAANLGRAVVEHIRRSGMRPGAGGPGVVDVVIIGSGPGGLSAALTCMRYGLSFVLIEKEQVISSTVARYPKGKNFMAEPEGARNLSFLPVFDASKEELVAAWGDLVAELQLPVRLGEAVESVEPQAGGGFVVKTTVGQHRAQRVVLATGLRGKPRLLAVPGANLAKVHAMLEDPQPLAGRKVLVVGGGDSAVEAALGLADAGAVAALSYRGDTFARAKPANQKLVADYAAAGRIELLLGSQVTGFTEHHATLTLSDKSERTLDNDHAFVLIGAEPPVAWLEKLGVRFVQRPHTYQMGNSDERVLAVEPDARDCPQDPAEAAALVRGRAQTLTERTNRRLHSVVEALEEPWTAVRTAVRRFGRALTGVTPRPELVRYARDAHARLVKEERTTRVAGPRARTRSTPPPPPRARTRSTPPPPPRARTRSTPPPPPRARTRTTPPPPPRPRRVSSVPPPVPSPRATPSSRPRPMIERRVQRSVLSSVPEIARVGSETTRVGPQAARLAPQAARLAFEADSPFDPPTTVEPVLFEEPTWIEPLPAPDPQPPRRTDGASMFDQSDEHDIDSALSRMFGG